MTSSWRLFLAPSLLWRGAEDERLSGTGEEGAGPDEG
jgi:hypothetical protein